MTKHPALVGGLTAALSGKGAIGGAISGGASAMLAGGAAAGPAGAAAGAGVGAIVAILKQIYESVKEFPMVVAVFKIFKLILMLLLLPLIPILKPVLLLLAAFTKGFAQGMLGAMKTMDFSKLFTGIKDLVPLFTEFGKSFGEFMFVFMNQVVLLLPSFLLAIMSLFGQILPILNSFVASLPETMKAIMDIFLWVAKNLFPLWIGVKTILDWAVLNLDIAWKSISKVLTDAAVLFGSGWDVILLTLGNIKNALSGLFDTLSRIPLIGKYFTKKIGGPIASEGLYMLHRGERVLAPGEKAPSGKIVPPGHIRPWVPSSI
jgi:hypothetical protein